MKNERHHLSVMALILRAAAVVGAVGNGRLRAVGKVGSGFSIGP